MTARIAPVNRETAPADARPFLDKLSGGFGRVPNLFATMGNSPAALGAYLAFVDALGKGSLSAREIELLNLHVSESNGCAYCVSAHSAVAAKNGLSRDEIAGAREGRAASAREAALLALARRIVRTGGGGTGGELARAREAGLSDAEIVEAVAHVASKTFTNALAQIAGTEIDFPRAPNLPQP
jgi:uncharacterized peroxidase-related enzyme